MIFKSYVFVVVSVFAGLINSGLPLAWAMGGSPTQQPGDGRIIALVKEQPITETIQNVYIRYRQKIDPYAIHDEASLQAEGMFFVNSTLLKMISEQCHDSHNVENANLRLRGSIPFQGVDGEFYYYIFAVDYPTLRTSLQGQCTQSQ